MRCTGRGVRRYTHFMLPSLTTSSSLRVTLDCSSLSLVEGESTHVSATDRIIDWLQNFPQRRGIHVYLRSSMNDLHGRRFKNKLQALGCTVTSIAFASSAS